MKINEDLIINGTDLNLNDIVQKISALEKYQVEYNADSITLTFTNKYPCIAITYMSHAGWGFGGNEWIWNADLTNSVHLGYTKAYVNGNDLLSRFMSSVSINYCPTAGVEHTTVRNTTKGGSGNSNGASVCVICLPLITNSKE